jgi:biopolymer transport protein ExbD
MNRQIDKDMALKRRTRVSPDYNAVSMTDIIFLLLIFFLISSTIVVPNAIKVSLPQSQKQTAAKPLARVTIDKDLNYYVAYGNEHEKKISFHEITPFLQEQFNKEPEMFVALYADESISYGEIVKILNIATENRYKMVLATRPISKKRE